MKYYPLVISLILLFYPACGQTREELFGQSSTTGAEWKTYSDFTLRSTVYHDFNRMKKAAKKDSIILFIVSAYRSFDSQKRIWERKWNDTTRVALSSYERANDILRYSAMPATSRHHWGTDIDLNSVEPDYFLTPEGQAVLGWLEKNAENFNFFRPYSEGRTKGYAPEPWHWSHRPTAQRFLERYVKTVSNCDIKGFIGCDTADSLDIIGNWVIID